MIRIKKKEKNEETERGKEAQNWDYLEWAAKLGPLTMSDQDHHNYIKTRNFLGDGEMSVLVNCSLHLANQLAILYHFDVFSCNGYFLCYQRKTFMSLLFYCIIVMQSCIIAR